MGTKDKGVFLETAEATLSALSSTVSSLSGTVATLGSNVTDLLGRAYAYVSSINVFTKAQRGAIVSVAYSATTTLDLSAGNDYKLATPTGAVNFANPTSKPSATESQGGVIVVPTSAYDGSHTWGTDYVNVPTLSGATSRYIIPYKWEGTNVVLGAVVKV